MIAQASGVEPAKVNYIAYAGGGEAQAAIMGGHVAAGISGHGEFAAQIKSGKLRALGISADKRVPGIDIPTLKEQGVDVEMVNWRASSPRRASTTRRRRSSSTSSARRSRRRPGRTR